jgi:hypothetical protein
LKNNSQNMDVVLQNGVGHIVFEGQEIEKQNFEALPRGIYFLRLKNASVGAVKLVKN